MAFIDKILSKNAGSNCDNFNEDVLANGNYLEGKKLEAFYVAPPKTTPTVKSAN